VRVELEPGALLPGEYRLTYELRSDDAPDRVLARSPEPLRLRITGGDRRHGAVTLPHRVHVERDATEVPR
jgi:hypothetical protein